MRGAGHGADANPNNPSCRGDMRCGAINTQRLKAYELPLMVCKLMTSSSMSAQLYRDRMFADLVNPGSLSVVPENVPEE